jgi:hypothetical protein
MRFSGTQFRLTVSSANSNAGRKISRHGAIYIYTKRETERERERETAM